MPGTIQVSVLDFEGLPSLSPISSISIKVSIGKREYQTLDQGDFSFPLTTLHDSLVVRLLDAEGNEISHTDVEIMSIVERGFWDDLFPFEGGGHVHMKLQFILSEDERNRIHNMRQTAMKKKQVELLSSSFRDSETTSTTVVSEALSSFHNSEISALSIVDKDTDAVVSSKPVSFFKDSQSSTGDEEETFYQKQATPNDTDGSRETSSSHAVEAHKDLSEEIQTLIPHADKLEKQDPLEETPSSVRKMISAFESSLVQAVKPHTKPAASKSQSSTVGTRSSRKNQNFEDVSNPVQPNKGRLNNITKREDHIGSGRDLCGIKSPHENMELESGAIYIRSKGEYLSPKHKFNVLHQDLDKEEERISPENLMRASAVETATISGRIFNQHSSRHRSSDSLTGLRDSGSTSIGSGRGIHLDESHEMHIQDASNDHKLKSVAYWEDEDNFLKCTGTWIFPDEARPLCITTGGKRVMDLTGGCCVEAKNRQGKKKGSVSENIGKRDVQYGANIEVKKAPLKLRKSRPEGSADDASTGPFGQLLKAAIIVGFGALVLLTRQRRPRKSSTEAENPFFTIQDYMDQSTLTDEVVDS